MTEDVDHAESLTRIAALIADKRTARVQLELGRIDADLAAERVRSADAELAKQWESLRTAPARVAPHKSPSA
jgi:hypothetical protein